MFISKVELPKDNKIFQIYNKENLPDLYSIHKLLWKLFPNDGTKKRDFLFQKDERTNNPCFYLVSKEKPVSFNEIKLETKIYAPKLNAGQKLNYSLTANPVVARKNVNNKRSLKHDVWMDTKRGARVKKLNQAEINCLCEEAVKKWLINKGSTNGFSINNERISVDGYIQNISYKKGSYKPIKFSSIHFEGILTVKEPDKFTNMLYTGLGRSKAFGCGLMLVRSVK